MSACLPVCLSQIFAKLYSPNLCLGKGKCCGFVCLFVSWPVSPCMDLNKRQYDLGRPDRWEYPTYLTPPDIKTGLSLSTLEIYSWLSYARPLLHAFVHFFIETVVWIQLHLGLPLSRVFWKCDAIIRPQCLPLPGKESQHWIAWFP